MLDILMSLLAGVSIDGIQDDENAGLEVKEDIAIEANEGKELGQVN